jgi:hypothetical protein
MPDGSMWELSASIVADNRANYHLDNSPEPDIDAEFNTYDRIFFETISDEDLLIDWAEGNMTWDEISEFAVKVEDSYDMDYHEGWATGMKLLVER